MTGSTRPRRTASAVLLNPAQLRLELAARGLDQQTLSQLAGLTPSTISKACRHGGPLTAGSVRRLAQALGSVEADPLAIRLIVPAADGEGVGDGG